jgi:hypothetical protein
MLDEKDIFARPPGFGPGGVAFPALTGTPRASRRGTFGGRYLSRVIRMVVLGVHHRKCRELGDLEATAVHM